MSADRDDLSENPDGMRSGHLTDVTGFTMISWFFMEVLASAGVGCRRGVVIHAAGVAIVSQPN